ncbi:MAG: glycosyltransferase involved in cell wall biosynthesis [Salibacteraceae bacterium]|jgi:glycosyltransferase involved in cell wall biosynthesis
MPKILFVAAHRKNRSPSQRFRFEQYIDFLKEQGFDSELSYLIEQEDDKRFYSPGNYFHKLKVLLRSFKRRKKDLKNIDQYDIIFIQREAFMTGSIKFETAYSKSKAKVVFDFDDSIWLSNVSEANKKLKFLKDADKTSKIIALSDMIFAGNQFLSDYASAFNKNIRIVPTTIDLNEYNRIPSEKNDKICIGWSGSVTTIQHFEFAIPFLLKIKEKYGDKVEFGVIGDGNYIHEELGIQGKPWIFADEIKELSKFDIGIMPLPNDKWASGKCGLKGLQYMALEIPTIMSPVGVNGEIIEHGVNGYLASELEEWVASISALIESEELRKSMGERARKTVKDSYSVESQKGNYVKFLSELIED